MPPPPGREARPPIVLSHTVEAEVAVRGDLALPRTSRAPEFQNLVRRRQFTIKTARPSGGAGPIRGGTSCGFCAKDCPGPKGEVSRQLHPVRCDCRTGFAKAEGAGSRPVMDGRCQGRSRGPTSAGQRESQSGGGDFSKKCKAHLRSRLKFR